MRKTAMLMILAAQALISRPGSAEAPALIPLQGVLEDSNGVPLDGHIDNIVFSIYTAPQDGELVWSETRGLNVVEGLFSVYLGGTSPLQLSWFADNQTLWLGVKVGSDPEMSRIRSVRSGGHTTCAARCFRQ